MLVMFTCLDPSETLLVIAKYLLLSECLQLNSVSQRVLLLAAHIKSQDCQTACAWLSLENGEVHIISLPLAGRRLEN